MTITAIIVAAGRGTRVGGDLPKQWRDLGGKMVVQHTLDAFARHVDVDQIVLVRHADDAQLAKRLICPNLTIVTGGASRTQSVLAGLKAAKGADIVLIHDAARPLIPSEVIDRVLQELQKFPGAAPALAITDALWRGANSTVTGTADREGLFRAQTPQGFHIKAILTAHQAHQGNAADDVEVARAAGLHVAIVAGDERNLKITYEADFERAAQLMRQTMDIRTGNGFDVHRFGPGDHVTLCGVQIPFEQGLIGHSDADVGMHAVTDAIYGALAMGDIGQHFPPSDPQWKGAESHIFLTHACGLAREMGFEITHADCTLICEFPKIGPKAEQMRAQMSRIMGITPDRMSVKATTSERLGFTGRGEGIAASATATLVKT